MSDTITSDAHDELMTAINERIAWLRKRLAYESKHPLSLKQFCYDKLKAAERAKVAVGAMTVIDE